MHYLYQQMVASPSVATWGSFSARALPLIILPPFVFRYLSTEEAALWFVLITLQGLQLLLESSVGLTFIRAIGFALGGATQVRNQREPDQKGEVGEPNHALLSQIWSAMRGLYPLVGLVTFFLVTAMALWSAPALIIQSEHPNEAWGALILFVSSAGLRAYGGLHISYLYGVGRITLLRWWEMAFWSVAFLAALCAILAGGGLMVVAVAYQVPLLLSLVWNAVLVRRDQINRAGFTHSSTTNRDLLSQVWPGMWRGSLGVMIYLGVTQGAGLYYAQIGSPDKVAIYLFAMSLMRPMIQFAQVPFSTKLPRLAALQVVGERKTQIALAQQGMFLSNVLLATMVIVAAGVLPLLGWLGGGRSANVPLLLWATIGLAAYLERIGAMHLQLYSQTNHIVWHWVNGGTAMLFIFFAWLLIPHLDALAFPASMCLAILVFYMPCSMWFSYQAYELSFPSFELRTSLWPLLLMVISFSVIGVST